MTTPPPVGLWRSRLPRFTPAIATTCAVVLLPVPHATAQRTPPSTPVDVALAETLAQDLLRVAKLPGLGFAALRDGRVVYAGGVGYRDLERRLPVDSSTQFAAASVSKVVAATAALRLIQAGRFDPEELVARRFPDFPGGDRMTARQLAAHTAGIPHYGPGSMPSRTRYVWASHALGEFSAARRVGAPGERSVYSTHGITLLSAMLEQAEQRPILDLLQREVFDPFDMPSSGGLWLDSIPATLATLYERSGDRWRPRDRLEFTYSWAGAGLRHTPADLVRMARPYFDGTFNARTLRVAFDEQRTHDGTPIGLGFVWRVERDWRGRQLAHHAGVNRGTRTVLLLRREQQQAVALMTNLEWTASAERTANVLAEALFDAAPRRAPLRVHGEWTGTLDTTNVRGSWAVQGDSGWISVPVTLQARFAQSGGVTHERVPVRAIRDDLYALVTPWGLSPLEITRAADGTVRAVAPIGSQRWTLVGSSDTSRGGAPR